MWGTIARVVLKFRWILLALLVSATAVMAYHASKVQLSYEFTRAIPTDNPKYQEYQQFRQLFGEDGNMMVIGVQTKDFFHHKFFNDYAELVKKVRGVKAVEDVLSVPAAANLLKDAESEKLNAAPVFPDRSMSQSEMDSCAAAFLSLPFYQGLLYNPSTSTYLMAIRINKDVLNSKARNEVVAEIVKAGEEFAKKHRVEMHYSGLPLIRTNMATKVASEMQWFLLGSIILSAVILLLFFRSVSAMVLSLAVVIIGVVWSLGTIEWCGYKISLLNALIPPLVVVIGIPNCIYFLNKFHTAFNDTDVSMPVKERKFKALHLMIERMGVVTLFCNIAAAIGFAVFALTKSAILKEFGVVAGINIMALFFISIILIPAVLSFLPAPKPRHTKYLDNKWLQRLLDKLEVWSLHNQRQIYIVTGIVLIVAVAGIFRLRTEGFIVDDLPKTDKIYTDLKFFEKHFKGVMPLEIVVDTKKKNGLRVSPLQHFEKIDSMSQFIAHHPEMARPLSIVEGLKFARQAYYEGDSASYGLPNSFDIAFLAQYLGSKDADSTGKQNNFTRIVRTFMDSTRQRARISVNMADVGTKRLPVIIDSLSQYSKQIFDTAKYNVQFTGTTVTFLEGSSFIINGLKESILWAFGLIALCMLYLFRSVRILICSLVPNIIPLVITAGVMGWAGVAIKPSTVLVFSVALGIAIDITIRFLVNYKQELQLSSKTSREIVVDTIHKTGISIIYTSLVLIAGFVIFCLSDFGGTKALGWLTSMTLVLATLTNLIFLPALLLSLVKK
ncbi:MMPL family transporter [Pseudoflavitalea sp. G-6-1-2]|uniref:efflux RND transporter permease subunit n=1 Tax=Pseudoflavitalea sp. G-6-1-2 TaxID=2728841 RepID=UPI001469CA45|nr:MMPL family transporter [Pseudoflavitalea sp. G-6-1-2]NML20394.1 MMPL family transporter [Pseudoflavitalea sp. G-6-1-2]